MEEKYWFVIRSSVFIWKKGSSCYFYDSESFAGKLFALQDPDITSLVNKLLDIDNLYSLEICQTELQKEALRAFIDTLISLGMGRLFNQKEIKGRPIQFPPILNLQSDVERLKKEGDKISFAGENVLLNLHSLQFELPVPGNDSFMEAACGILDAVYIFISEIMITGYHPCLNTYQIFWEKMRESAGVKKFGFDLSSLTEEMVNGLRALDLPHIQIKFLIKPGFNPDKLERFRQLFAFATLFYEFEVFEEADCEPVDKLTSDWDPAFLHIQPRLNGKNLDFFKKYVYITQQDLERTRQTKQNIFAHQALNTNDFGKLRITSDGNVYANLHHAPLGKITDDIHRMVYQEMYEGTSWRRVRNSAPCSDCVYQWLCPSLSDYELEIGRPDLCFKNES